MGKKLKVLFLTLLSAVMGLCLIAGLAACKGGDEFKGVRVVFELEGGTFKNSQLAITYYYNLAEGASAKILRPEQCDSRNEVTLTDHHIPEDGWCRKKEVNEDGTVTYSEPWDFENDTISYGDEGVTLYAAWKPDIYFTYDVCYYDDANEVQVLGSYDAIGDMKFHDTLNYAESRIGYTAMREMKDGALKVVYYKENGEVWDDDFVHPGGETSLAIKVFVKYLKGRFTYVTNAKELTTAAANSANIYLYNDIDLEGATFSGFKDQGGNYTGTFLGNSHKISNFKFTYNAGDSGLISDNDLGGDNILCISLFGRLNGATVQEVSFEGVTVELGIELSKTKGLRFAPIGVKATNSTVKDVSFSGSVTLKKLNAIVKGNENYTIKTDAPFFLNDAASNVTGCTVNIDYKDEVNK